MADVKAGAAFNDVRLENRYGRIASELETKNTCIVGQLFENWSEVAGLLPFLQQSEGRPCRTYQPFHPPLPQGC